MSLSEGFGVSAIVPARNEEVNIARVVKSLAEQQGIKEILVVNDQSTDRTGEILRGLASEISFLHILNINALPAGWMGKTYAVAQAASSARGDWLLFTDADTCHLPGSLAEMLRRAEAEHVDLLSLSPGQETPTWWEKSVIPAVFLKLATLFRFEDVSDPQSPAAAANGQYLLVRKGIYERSGGHEAVRSAILEDVELARRVKSMGGRLLFLPGAPWVRTRMYQTFPEMWQGWTKNLYLLYEGNVAGMLGAVAEVWLWELLPVLAFVAACFWFAASRGRTTATLILVGLLVVVLLRQWSGAEALERLGFELDLVNYQPLGAALFGALLLNSLRAHRISGNIQWKGRTYSTRGQG